MDGVDHTFKDTVTLVIDGEVSLQTYATTLQRFVALVEAITAEAHPHARIEWSVEDLRVGSAIVTIRAVSSDVDAIRRAIDNFEQIGFALQRRRTAALPLRVSRAGQEMVKVFDKGITALRFETEDVDIAVHKEPLALPAPEVLVDTIPIRLPPGAYGAIEGTIEALFRRRGHRFTLYDRVFDKAVSCYLRPDQEEMMRDLWGRRAIVEGWVTRDPVDGRPTSIRQVTAIEALPNVEPGSFLRARGILAPWPDGPSPTEVIRQSRDG